MACEFLPASLEWADPTALGQPRIPREHLDTCSECALALQQLVELESLLAGRFPEPPADLVSRTIALVARRSFCPRPRWTAAARIVRAGALAIAAAALVGIFPWEPSVETPLQLAMLDHDGGLTRIEKRWARGSTARSATSLDVLSASRRDGPDELQSPRLDLLAVLRRLAPDCDFEMQQNSSSPEWETGGGL